MKYQYKIVYRVTGISHSGEINFELVNNKERGVRACLSSDYSDHCDEADRIISLAVMMLSGKDLEKINNENDHLIHEMAKIKAERDERHKKGPFLIFQQTGDIPYVESQAKRETDNFVVEINGESKLELQKIINPTISSLIFSLSTVLGETISVHEVCKSTVFFRPDRKPVYPLIVEGRPVGVSVSSSLTKDDQLDVERYFESILDVPELHRVIRLYLTSLQSEGDTLRSFLASWSALEIFVSKIFSVYVVEWFNSLSQNYPISAYGAFLGRISEVMKDKYRLSDKFSILAVRLSPDEADNDLKKFNEAKELRDKLLHAGEIKEDHLPVNLVQSLLIKYFRLYLNDRGM